MKRLGTKVGIAIGLACGFAGGLPAASLAADSEVLARLAADRRVGAETVAALAEGAEARVMVAFGLEAGRTRRPVPRAAGPEYRDAVARVTDELLLRVPEGDFRLIHRYQWVRAFAGTITAAGAAALLEDPRVLRIDLDAGGTGHLAQSVPLSQLDDLQTMGLTGAGITVAVLDSGIDTDHPDLGDDLVAERCFCGDNNPNPAGCCPGGTDDESGPGSAEDDHNHGSNVSGIVTSKGMFAPVGGAPDAGIVAIKVLDSNNNFCCASDITMGLEWILSDRPDVDVVNMSLGTFDKFTGECDDTVAYTMAMADAIDALRAAGVLSFVSSGNEGLGDKMGAPACIANSIAVGAVWDANVGMQTAFCTETTTAADKVTCFSNSNSTTDLFAPGAPITSAGIGPMATTTFYGTSQAAPLCAACAALLLESYPDLTADQIEALLESSSTLVTDATNGLSLPRLDCLEAHTPCGDPLTWDLDQATPVTGVEDLTACLEIRAGQYPIAGTGEVTHTAGERIVFRNDFTVALEGKYTAALDPALAVLP